MPAKISTTTCCFTSTVEAHTSRENTKFTHLYHFGTFLQSIRNRQHSQESTQWMDGNSATGVSAAYMVRVSQPIRPLPAASGAASLAATPETWEAVFAGAQAKGRPVFVDVWASWCKNCLAMERTTFRAPEVVRALAPFTVVRLQAEDPAAFQKLKDFAGLGIKGFPAFVIFPHEP